MTGIQVHNPCRVDYRFLLRLYQILSNVHKNKKKSPQTLYIGYIYMLSAAGIVWSSNDGQQRIKMVFKQ